MANQVANAFKGMILKGQVAALADTFKIILMETDFVYDKDTHHCYADVTANELPTANGYTAGGQTLVGAAVAVNDTLDRAEFTFNDAQWNATGGALTCSGAIIFDDTASSGAGDDYTDAIVCYMDANGNLTAPDSTPLRVEDITVLIS